MRDRYVTHLESAIDHSCLDADRLQSMYKERPLWVRYDLEQLGKDVSRDDVARRNNQDLWRYRELLPVGNLIQPVSLGERMTPLLNCPTMARLFGLDSLLVKDESQLPGGSFKSRGMTMAITMARHFGVQRVALPTAGNAGGAAAAYAARAGIECFVFMPEDTPIVNQYECELFGAKVFLVTGLINDCGKIVRQGTSEMGWFDLSTLKEPYRIEGKKTMGLELAEQLNWQLPDVIMYPTGGGTGLIGMWKAFAELQTLGWLSSSKMPRMYAIQSAGCAPIVRAFNSQQRFAEPFENAATIASGLRVPTAVGDFMILDAIRQSGGKAIAVDEAGIAPWMKKVCQAEGIAVCPETACCFAALEELRKSQEIQVSDQVVIFNTGAAQKYVEAIRAELPRFDPLRSIHSQT